MSAGMGSEIDGGGGRALSVLAIVGDEPTRALLAKVVRDPLRVSADLTDGLASAQQEAPDVAFVEIGMGDGAGLALVHHLKAVAPEVAVYALASREALEAAANAVALGSAGIIMLPAAGDEILLAVDTVRAAVADRASRLELARASSAYATATKLLEEASSLGAAPSREAAAARCVDLFSEAAQSGGAAVYLATAERPAELTRLAATPTFATAPHLGSEHDVLEYARRECHVVVRLAAAGQPVGLVLLAPPASDAPSSTWLGQSDALKLLGAYAGAALALVTERERATVAAIKDPASSAYSFAYYVDVAGREIDKARRYGRRFALAIVVFERPDGGRPPPLSHAEMADQLLKAARDTDVLAQVDEHEFHLLMPETDGLGAHAARRRVLARIAERVGKGIPEGLLVGVATFPHDGADLSQLLRVARRRADATRYSLVRRLRPEQTGLLELIDIPGWDAPREAIYAARPVRLPLTDAGALGAAVVTDAVRGGAATVVLANHDQLGFGSAVRAALGPSRENVTVHAIDLRNIAPGHAIEALAVLAEHGAYALIGRREGAFVRGLHAADPLLTDHLAERLGRAAGLRLFS